MSKQKFNINDYPGDYVMHCDTEDKARVFCDYLDLVSLQWCTNHSYKNKTYFGENLDKTVYYFNYGRFGAVHFVDDGYKILEFDDFDWSGWEEEKKVNYTKQFAEMLGVEVGEKFNVLYSNGNVTKYSPYKIDEGRGIIDKDDDPVSENVYVWILTGEYTIQKLPWKPEYREEVWHISAKGSIFHDCFDKNSCVDLALYAIGNCFETKEEAEKNKDKIMKMQKEIKEELE